MPIEEDLANMLKHANFSGIRSPKALLDSMQLSLLLQMKRMIDDRIGSLSAKKSGVAHMDLDPFEILGVDPDASWDDIEQAYRQKSAQHHPDKGGDNMEMAKVNAAYEVLKRFKKEGT